MKRFLVMLLAIGLSVVPSVMQAQVIFVPEPGHIVPPIHPRPPIRRPVPTSYKIRSVDVNSTIRDQVAKVQFSQVFQNTGSGTLEAKLIFPMPDDAQISDLTLIVDGKELTGRLLKKEEARRIYEEIVRRRRDPALLEYIGHGLFQTSVFPIPAGAQRTVEIRYSQLLRKENGLINLLLPIGTGKHSPKPIDKLNVTIRVDASGPIKTVYSPSHKIDIQRPDNTRAVCKLSLETVRNPDDFRLYYGTETGAVGMNVISYRPKTTEDGFFLLLASPEVKTKATVDVARTMVFVFDRSGSMTGKKIEQAKDALTFLVNQLKPTDTFNIVAYDSEVESFRPELQRADEKTLQAARGFVDGLYAGGSTNIDGALQTALRMLSDPNRPSYVLFLTDGLPTVGERNDVKIAASAKQANAAGARLFSFGVGFDVNSRLLTRLSRNLRGQSVFVRPNEDIEAQVSSLYGKIASPLLTELNVAFDFDVTRSPGSASPVSRTYPRDLPDLFHGEQLVLVGRYRQSGLAKVTLAGSLADGKRTFSTAADFVNESIDETNGFVEKLWAARRIAEIIDELDLNGHNQELVNELVQLSTKHGIMTPYTSFLADENVHLAERDAVSRRAGARASRELARTKGKYGFAQRAFKSELQNATTAPKAAFGGMAADYLGEAEEYAESLQQVRTAVRNIGQKTFFRKRGCWRDSAVSPEQEQRAVRIVQFSPEYFDLAASHGGKLAKYLAFSEPVILNLGDRTYQIDPPADPSQE